MPARERSRRARRNERAGLKIAGGRDACAADSKQTGGMSPHGGGEPFRPARQDRTRGGRNNAPHRKDKRKKNDGHARAPSRSVNATKRRARRSLCPTVGSVGQSKIKKLPRREERQKNTKGGRCYPSAFRKLEIYIQWRFMVFCFLHFDFNTRKLNEY